MNRPVRTQPVRWWHVLGAIVVLWIVVSTAAVILS